MPDDLHAVSACLPLWEHNIGYEEGDPAVISKLQAAYPRFCFHPLVQQVCDRYLNKAGVAGLPFVSKSAAARAIEYVLSHGCQTAQEIEFPNSSIRGVSVATQSFPLLKQYWQHAGENVSSRVAELLLNDQAATCSDTQDRRTVKQRVANIQETAFENVFLFPSGMAAIAATWRAIQQGWPGSTCQFGFPYVDTLKMQQRFPNAQHTFLPVGDSTDINKLRLLCESATPGAPSAVFCEVPTNPLLVTPDLPQLRQLADQYGFLLVVDDTLSACGNLQLLPIADVLVTSLTKYFSGYGNVLAGAATLNPAGPKFEQIQSLITADFEETLADVDVAKLRKNSADVVERTQVINRNAAALADMLRADGRVQSVFYPTVNDRVYETLRTPTGGYGGLMSIVLNDAPNTTPRVFDALEVCKGPNLGTHFTLCCPYTILAHYTELEFAEQCGVSRWLLRISVGTEPIDELKRRFQSALSVV